MFEVNIEDTRTSYMGVDPESLLLFSNRYRPSASPSTFFPVSYEMQLKNSNYIALLLYCWSAVLIELACHIYCLIWGYSAFSSLFKVNKKGTRTTSVKVEWHHYWVWKCIFSLRLSLFNRILQNPREGLFSLLFSHFKPMFSFGKKCIDRY